MKSCMFAIMDQNFMPGYRVFMYSFLKHNTWFDWDFIITDVGLTEDNKSEIKSIYSKVIFRKPNYKDYEGTNFNATHPRLRNTYYFLDVFSLRGYNKIVSVDVDMVVLGDLSPVFIDSNNKGMSGARGYNSGKDKLSNDVNVGLFVVGSDFINEKTYRDLLAIAKNGHSMPEQKTMNIYFKGRWHYFDKKYNLEKRILHTKKYKHLLKDPVVIHYVATKPWQDHKNVPARELTYKPWENLWHKMDQERRQNDHN